MTLAFSGITMPVHYIKEIRSLTKVFLSENVKTVCDYVVLDNMFYLFDR